MGMNGELLSARGGIPFGVVAAGDFVVFFAFLLLLLVRLFRFAVVDIVSTLNMSSALAAPSASDNAAASCKLRCPRRDPFGVYPIRSPTLCRLRRLLLAVICLPSTLG